ncbi:rotatin isoform X2 [Eucyclogobius newberryi]|uniref:rotatin isoform X2 n=1 Tax=Eucyclogobius newberryi TaxID=166745 RepID=UPI003B5B75D0
MELSSLIKKMGHSLVEIRVRALKNIICKLDHSLISVADIVQEKMLFVYLLEWFNFPEVPMQEDALELITTISKHPSAAQMLRDVGAVDFLTQLSPKVEPRLRAVIDGALDQLFHLPELLPSHTIVYSSKTQTITATAPDVPETDEASPHTGYFHKGVPSLHDLPSRKIRMREIVKCLKFSVFPWITLTNTDRHILSSNESSLRSSNPNLVRTTCELLRDVIMLDFPSEVFLQRPGIVKILLSLLSLGSSKGEKNYLYFQALSCLRQLCVGLRRRLRFHLDPSFYSTKQDPVSQNSSFSLEVRGSQHSQTSSPAAAAQSPRPSVVGRPGQRARGDGQDGDATPNSGSAHRGAVAVQAPRQTPQSPVAHLELPDLCVEDGLELQLQQLTLAQFSVAAIQHSVSLLKTESSHVFHRALELLSEAVLLLGDSVLELVWDDGSLVGLELKEKLQASMELLGDILNYHHNYSEEIPQNVQIHHKMAYTGTAIFTIKLLQTILPPEKASENLPENTATAIFHLCLDPSLGSVLPGIQETAVAYLEQVNSDHFDLYRMVTRATLWMDSTCNFVKEAQAEGDKNWLELLELADQAIEGLPFHQHLPIIKECVQICSYLWKFDQPSPLLQTESQKLLLKLLSHPLQSFKAETYACVLNLVKDCLGIQNVSRLEPGTSSGVCFLLHFKVLYEICAFGLQDSAQKVHTAAKDILLFLLKGQLMMAASLWDRLNEALYPIMPILQGYANTEESLGNCVLLISDMSDAARDNMFSSSAKLKAALRLLFTKQPSVRIAAVNQILPHLTSADGAQTDRPELDQLLLSSLPNLFCLKIPVDIALDSSSKSLLKVESVEKLFCILASETVDISLKRSAAEQLSVVLQDTTMHPVVKSLGISDKVLSFIMECVCGNASLDGLLEPCVRILRKLVFADPSMRHGLAQRSALLLTLLRASLILKENKGNSSDVTVLICLLLFDDIASFEMWSDEPSKDVRVSSFSLPLTVTRRYNIPFQSATHHAVSPYCCVLPPSSKLWNLLPARHALQVAWNTAWHSGIEGLFERPHESGEGDQFHTDLKLCVSQVELLRAMHYPTALRDCVQAIATAAGHSSVFSALSRLRLYLLMDKLALPHALTHCCRETMHCLSWHAAMTRFLQVHPACVEDEKLLVAIVEFLNDYFKQAKPGSMSEQEDRDLRWILELLLNQDTACLLHLLLGAESQNPREEEELNTQVSQRLQRELTFLFNTLLHCLQNTTDRLCLALAGPFQSQLAERLLQSLRVSDAPHFYGLPSLERTLQGMVCLTAQAGWSAHCPDPGPVSLCSKYLSGLLEVISSFYVEWGGNSMSFMGKGVTKSAAVCLLHLSSEMMAENKDEDVISQWSLGNETNEEANNAHLGLAWLIPLWVDRDPEVRCASLGLGAALSSVPAGCQALCASCLNISGGLWGTLLNILLDRQESSMVRREAAFILQNLLVMPMPANAEEAKDSPWQHPCVHDEVSGVSLVGLPALQALLYHYQYFQHVASSAAACYRGRYTPHLQPHAVIAHGAEPGENTSQGQSDTETSASVSSQDSQQGEPAASEPVVIVTPDLLTAHCSLLSNLLSILPDFTLNTLRRNRILHALSSVPDFKLMEKCLDDLKSPCVLPGERADAKSQLLTLLQFLSAFSKLLQSCVAVSQEPIGQLDFMKQLLTSLVAVLTLDTKGLDPGSQDTVRECWAEVFMLLALLVMRDSSAAYPSISATLARRWRSFAVTLSTCMSEKSSNSSLHTAALLFVSTVLAEETKKRDAEDQNSASALSEVLSGPSSEQLCDLLLQSFEKRTLQDPLKKHTARALMTLLACSLTAQNYAAKAGLIDSSVEQLKQIYSQLNLESARPGRTSHRKKEDVYLKEVKLTVEILQSALYCNDECRIIATDARLTLALYALWPWLLLDDPSLEAVLELLCVYTAKFTTACSSLCGSGPGVVPGSKGSSGSSLMHSIMKLASGFAPDNSSIQKLAFYLLTNLSISRDCRGLLQKHNFLQGFLSLPVPKASVKSSVGTGGVLGLWLKLLLSLSVSEDGQQSVLRLTGALEALADLASQRHHALLTLHNLCFCPANKPHVIANKKAMMVLVGSLESQDPETCCTGASALWALLHNNQKAKTSLKCPSIRLRIEEAYTSFNKDKNQKKPMRNYLMKCLENLSQLLKN